MAKFKDLPGLKATKYNIKQNIKYSDMVEGYNHLSLADKMGLQQDALDLITKRTMSGKDVFGSGLKSPYSPAYSKSFKFRALGKSRGDINMRLKGQMLRQMDVIDQSSASFTLGWNEPLNQKKAANHNQGVTLPVRQFFGLTNNDMERIGSRYTPETPVPETQAEETISFLDQLSSVGDLTAMFGFTIGGGPFLMAEKVGIDVARLKFKITKRIRRIYENEKLWLRVANEILRLIKGNARLSEGVSKNGKSASALAGWKDGPSGYWATYRQNLFPQGDFFLKNKSNLNLSGDLLDSLQVTASKKGFVIQPTGTHGGYVNLSTGNNVGGGSTMQDILDGQAAQGRRIMGITPEYQEVIRAEIRNEMRRQFSRNK